MKKKSSLYWRVVIIAGIAIVVAIGLTGRSWFGGDEDGEKLPKGIDPEIQRMYYELAAEKPPFPLEWWFKLKSDEERKAAYEAYLEEIKGDRSNWRVNWPTLKIKEKGQYIQNYMDMRFIRGLSPQNSDFIEKLGNFIMSSEVEQQQGRTMAVKRVHEWNGPEAAELLGKVLKKRGGTRWRDPKKEAVNGLFELKTTNAPDVIAALLLDSGVESEYTRLICNKYSMARKPPPVVEEALRALAGGDREALVREAASKALERCKIRPADLPEPKEVSGDEYIQTKYTELRAEHPFFPLEWWVGLPDEDKIIVYTNYQAIKSSPEEWRAWDKASELRREAILEEKFERGKLRHVIASAKSDDELIAGLAAFIRTSTLDNIRREAVDDLGAIGSDASVTELDSLARDGSLGFAIQRRSAEWLVLSKAPSAPAAAAKFLLDFDDPRIIKWMIQRLPLEKKAPDVIIKALIVLAGREDEDEAVIESRVYLERFGIEYGKTEQELLEEELAADKNFPIDWWRSLPEMKKTSAVRIYREDILVNRKTTWENASLEEARAILESRMDEIEIAGLRPGESFLKTLEEKIMSTPHEESRKYAVDAILKEDSPEAVALLSRILVVAGKNDWRIAGKAATDSLFESKDSGAPGAILGLISADTLGVDLRRYMIGKFSSSSPPGEDGAALLKKLAAEDPDERIRTASTNALKRCGIDGD